MTVEQEVANLTTSVDNLTDAVNVKKATLDTSVADSTAARDAAQGFASSASASESSAETARTQAELAATAAGATLYDSTASGLPGTTDGDVFLVSTEPGVQVYRNDTGSATLLGWLGEVLFDDAPAFFASTDTFTADTCVRTRAEGFAYRAVDYGGWFKNAGDQLFEPVSDPNAGFGPLANPTFENYTPSASDPRVVTSFDGVLYGAEEAIYAKTSRTGSWAQVAPNPAGGRPVHLVPMSDGEVIAVTGSTIEKSSGWGTGTVTWANKVTNSGGAAVFLGYATAGSDGVKMIVAEYGTGSAGSGWENSKKAWATKDSGNTWSVVYNSSTLFPSDFADTHIHGACYDAEMDLFFVIEGHTSSHGIYWNPDPFADATNWTRIEAGAVGGVVSGGQPTNIVPTSKGIVCASDGKEQGIWVIRRAENPADLQVDWLWEAPWGRGGVLSFGQSHSIDPETGTVYFGFSFNAVTDSYVPLNIIASDGETAGFVWDGGPTTAVTPSQSNAILKIAVAPWGEVIASTTSNSFVGQKKIVGRITRGRGYTRDLDPGNVLGGLTGETNIGRALAVGQGSQATDNNTVAVGMTAQASTIFSTAIGSKARALFQNSTVIGALSEATGVQSVAIGFNTKAGQRAVNIGDGGDIPTGGLKIGSLQTVTETGISIGDGCTLTGIRSVVIGRFAEASGQDSMAIGQNAVASHVGSTAIGYEAETSDNYQINLGATHIEIESSVSAPVAGASGTARLYTKTNGSGKQELRVQFPTGSSTIIATEA